MRSKTSVPAIAGTVVLAIPAAATYAAGIIALWMHALNALPLPLGVLVAGGLVIAPLQLLQDVVAAGRPDEQERMEKDEDLG